MFLFVFVFYHLTVSMESNKLTDWLTDFTFPSRPTQGVFESVKMGEADESIYIAEVFALFLIYFR